MRSVYYSISGDATGEERWRLFIEPGEPILNAFTEPKEFPSWLSARAIDYYVDEYTHGIYRCPELLSLPRPELGNHVVPGRRGGPPAEHVHRWRCRPFLEPIEIRALYDRLDTYLPGLWKKVLLPGVGHSAAEESPDQVNELLVEFLEQLER